MESSIVSIRNEGDIAIITMDDGKANALSPAMLADLGTAFDEVEKPAKAVILAGRPGRFSAGFDLKVMMSGPDNAKGMLMAGGELALRLYEFPLPVVMAVSGHAIAGGVLLAACGDVRIGVNGPFKLGLNEIQNGMPVPILLHDFARDRLINSEFIPAVLQSKMYTSEEAVVAGWLDQSVEGEKLAEVAMSEATRLSKLTGRAYHMTKKSIRATTISRIRSTMDENISQLTGSL